MVEEAKTKPQSRSSSLVSRRRRRKERNKENNDRLNTSFESTAATSAPMVRSRSNGNANSNGNSHKNINTNSNTNNKKKNNLQRVSELNRSGFSSGLSSKTNNYSSSSRRHNRIYQFDDISSLHCDEYGYDRKPPRALAGNDNINGNINGNINIDDDDEDSVSEFFQAPTKQELSTELFQLVDRNNNNDDGDDNDSDSNGNNNCNKNTLESLAKLRKWGIIADSDPTTMMYLVEFQAVPTLLYFVRAAIAKRRSLKQELVEKLQSIQKLPFSEDKSTEFRKYQHFYKETSNHNEQTLQQAMHVIHHYTCFSDTTTTTATTNKKKSLKSLVLKKAILAQLVDIDGVDLLVDLLEEQLEDLQTNTTTIATPTTHAISKSIWLVLMNVGACDHAIQLLKRGRGNNNNNNNNTRKQQQQQHSRARRLVYGIVMGLNHRFKTMENNSNRNRNRNRNRTNTNTSKSTSSIMLHIMPQWALSSGIDCYNRHNDLFEIKNIHININNNNIRNSSSWMEDLFVALCRLIGSKDTEHLDKPPNHYRHRHYRHRHYKQSEPEQLQPNEHDEIRIQMIDLCVVQKCLRALLDEPNAVLGKDPFVTTLAMSFFYACIRFGSYRYKLLKQQQQQQKQQQQHYSIETVLARSLDYDKLVEFTLESVRSFPSHHLIQGTGCLLLESIQKTYNSFGYQYQYLAKNLDCLGSSIATTKQKQKQNRYYEPHNNNNNNKTNWDISKTVSCWRETDDLHEPCQWYFSTA